MRKLFLQWLPWILRMHRPKKPITRKTIMMSSRMRELEMKEGRNSKSLLSNVLDMDDDFRWMSFTSKHLHTKNLNEMSVGSRKGSYRVGQVGPISIVKTVKRKKDKLRLVWLFWVPPRGWHISTGTFCYFMVFLVYWVYWFYSYQQENISHVKIM